jgi:hypothetical protein
MSESREQRIASLAATLKSSGIAKSEVQARVMAEEMIGVEEGVQKRFDDEHQKAHDYLKTAKNLGEPRYHTPKQETPVIQPLTQKPAPQQNITQSRPVDISAHDRRVQLEEVHTDLNFGSKPLSEVARGSNSEIERIKQAVQEQFTLDAQKEKIEEDRTPIIPTPEPVVTPKIPDDIADTKDSALTFVPAQGLDAAKLTAMMEEDGPLEEHTREIKEKPKIVKPKEEYAENNIDLSNVFNFNK